MEKPQAGDRPPTSTALANQAQPSLSPYVVDSGAELEAKAADNSAIVKHSPETELLDQAEPMPIVPVGQAALTSPQRRSATAAKRRSPATFRRLWEVKLSQEMQQLGYQAQVQQINQGLADRARARVQSGQMASSGADVYGSYALPERLAQKSRRSSFAPIEEAVKMTDSERHSEQAHHPEIDRINQVLAHQERDRAESQSSSMALPARQSIPQEPTQTQLSSGSNPFNAEAFTPDDKALPTQPPLTPLPSQKPVSTVNWQQAEQEAGQTAAALRYLSANRERGAAKGTQPLPTPLPDGSANRRGAPEKRWIRLPHGLIDKLGDAVLWVVAIATVRVAINLVLVALPALTPVVTLLMVTPALLAIALAFFVPNASFLLIYRLFLISIGLLLGGKL